MTETVKVEGDAPLVETSSNALGRVITGRELVDLPLNGRNFTQLGLLQTGVAPLTAGVAAAGGSLRQGQAYAVNGMRPEQNMYLVDGAQNVNRMDGGYALKLPVDAIAEFRIFSQSAPAEYGGTAGATTSVVTRSGSNQFHGTVYDFVRNDSVRRTQLLLGGGRAPRAERVRRRDRRPDHARPRFCSSGITKACGTSRASRPARRCRACRSGRATSPRSVSRCSIWRPAACRFPDNRIPEASINPVARNVVNLYPVANISPSLYRETVLMRNDLDQAGGRVDLNLSSNDQLFARYSFSGGHNLNPVSVRGTDAPGFPTRDDLATHAVTASSTHILSPSLTNSLRGTFLRHEFLFDQRLNRTPPSALGFGYSSSNDVGQGPPFFNVSGYSPIGGAITGPRNTTQHTFEIQDSVAWTNQRHLLKAGAEFRNIGIDMVQAIAPNAFFVFAGTFPTNNAVANLLLGAPVTFYQGLGDFTRDVRVWGLGAFAQDEWRVTSRLTFNYGLRYERINPFTEIHDRLNGFVPNVQSRVRPDAPLGLVFPGDPGIGRGIADSVNAFMPRVGAVWDPTGEGVWAVRASYGLFYDQFQNGAGAASQVAVSATPWAQFVQFSGAGLNFQNPYQGRPSPGPETFVRPSTVFALDPEARPPVAENWNLSIQRSLFDKYLVELRYVGASARDLPRNVEANPAVYAPGATAQNADRRRIYADCPADGSACALSTVAMLRSVARSSYHAGQASVSRRFRDAVAFNASVLVLEVARSSVGDESLGRRREAACGGERSRTEPVRPRRRVGSVALRCPSPLRRERELGGAAADPCSGSRSVGARRLAGQRDRGAQFGHAVHGL